MILAEIEIEDYKQYAGAHRFEPTPEGVIGIIGPNGVGKTTLFEAIEWCLYQPRGISAEDVWPRGRAGKPRVRIVLLDPATEHRYVVERTLRKSGANAEIYREDQPETRITHGSRQVTEYVSRNLIGLGHRAFVSTFFTRQKELTFFGNLKETERRREVGRLLGLETIRAAQRQIGEDRAKAQSESRVLRLQYEEQSAGRDFVGEAAEADRIVDEHGATVSVAEGALTAAVETVRLARATLEHLRDQERRDAEIRRQEERVAGDEREATARRDAANRAIADLDRDAALRGELEPVAASAAAQEAAVNVHEAERERHADLQRRQSELRRIDLNLAKVADELRGAVIEASAADVDGWTWAKQEVTDLVAVADRLIAVAVGVDATAALTHAAALASCFNLARARDKASDEFAKVELLLVKLERDHDALLSAGDPREDAARAQAAREAALQAAQESVSNAENARKTREELAPIVESLQTRRFEGHCPTCGRPFAEHEAAITLEALRDRIDDLSAKIGEMDTKRQEAEKAAKINDRARTAALARQNELATIEGRITQGKPIVEQARATFDEALIACQKALSEHGLDGEPGLDAVQEAETNVQMLQRVVSALPSLRRLRARARQHQEEDTAVRTAIADLGPIAYDAAAHAEATRGLQRAQSAAAQIIQIDQNLAQRPARVAEREVAMADLARHGTERVAIEAQRVEIGFDQHALDAEVKAEQAALGEERAALDARNAARTTHKDAVAAREALLAEQQRIAGLVDRADIRQREADLLDQMYREFTQFDQYVAARVTPQLAEHASELLGAVTEGKYDRVEFDENYGIMVYDGVDERFPVEDFSGGERDVIALCARLALSRLVGSQATNPPGFLVLDEVFGSLDRERRAQVLETLGQLSGTAEAFQQLFIISHVDDVRASPIFSEVWRASETSEGESRLENLNLSGGVEEV